MMRDRFHSARLLSFVTGLVNQELNRILRAHLLPDSACPIRSDPPTFLRGGGEEPADVVGLPIRTFHAVYEWRVIWTERPSARQDVRKRYATLWELSSVAQRKRAQHAVYLLAMAGFMVGQALCIA